MHYLYAFLISMVPFVELRGAVIYAAAWDLNPFLAMLVCTVGNMIPVPFIYFLARRGLNWGAKRAWIGGICRWALEKGEKAGQSLAEAAGRKGMFMAMILFVGIPLPGTGAWIGTLGASFLNMGFKSTVVAMIFGVIISGTIMMALSLAGFSVFT